MAYFIRKLAILLLTLFLVSLAVFLAFHVIPGDSAMLILGTEASEESLAAPIRKSRERKPQSTDI